MTLIQFLNSNTRNAWVTYPGVASLYVRKGQLYIGDRKVDNVLTIASIEIAQTNQGTFTKLINMLRNNYPGMTIYVENVLNPQFDSVLRRLSFCKDYNNGGIMSRCWFLPAEEEEAEDEERC